MFSFDKKGGDNRDFGRIILILGVMMTLYLFGNYVVNSNTVVFCPTGKEEYITRFKDGCYKFTEDEA